MSWNGVLDGLQLCAEQDSYITIGGGEPTMHPRFFDILKRALDDPDFEHVWMATNGSNLKAMRRLANIIDGNDYESFEQEDYCNCDPEALKDDNYQCYCMPTGIITQEHKLGVALSQDHFHERDKVDPWVVNHWCQAAKNLRSGYEVRDVTTSSDNIAAQGRAKRTGVGWADHCVCSDHIIRPDGTIKLCGCTASPIIGSIRNGIDSTWRKKINLNDHYQDTKCYKAFKRSTR
jgi:MoaA/NifB/PqqE/SkfB family radical SAM enzyme